MKQKSPVSFKMRTVSSHYAMQFVSLQATNSVNTRYYQAIAMTHAEIAYYFKNLWLPSERQTALELMRCVDSLLQKASVEYLVYGGTLLSYIHDQRLLDFDDDIDFLVIGHALPTELINLFQEHELGIEKHPKQNLHKVFFRSSPRLTKAPWGFPFIDLAFGYIAGNYFCHDSVYGGIDRFDLNDVFPLRRDFLEGVEVSIPQDPIKVAVTKYGTECLTSALPPAWDHKLARPTGFPQIRVPLSEIEEAIPKNAS